MNSQRMEERGFTLVEMMVSMTIMMFVVIALITLIMTTQSAHLTEGRKLDMNQGARVVEQMLYDGFRSAGSVLSLANTPTILGSPAALQRRLSPEQQRLSRRRHPGRGRSQCLDQAHQPILPRVRPRSMS